MLSAGTATRMSVENISPCPLSFPDLTPCSWHGTSKNVPDFATDMTNIVHTKKKATQTKNINHKYHGALSDLPPECSRRPQPHAALAVPGADVVPRQHCFPCEHSMSLRVFGPLCQAAVSFSSRAPCALCLDFVSRTLPTARSGTAADLDMPRVFSSGADCLNLDVFNRSIRCGW